MGGKGNDWTVAASPGPNHGCADDAHEPQGFNRHELGRKGEILREERYTLWTTIRHKPLSMLARLSLPAGPKCVPSLGREGMPGPVNKHFRHRDLLAVYPRSWCIAPPHTIFTL